MQRGHIRFEPNINVEIEKDGQTFRTPIVEIKNLNSFKAVYGSIAYEYHRQVDQWLESGSVNESGAKSTRGWDDVKMVTFLQREKEEAHDYRYFPDPDLVPLVIAPDWVEQIKATVTELPLDRQKRYVQKLHLNIKDAQQVIEDPEVTAFFEEILAVGVDAKRAAAMLLNYAAKRANERTCQIHELGITPQQIKGIADLAAAQKIGSSAANELFGLCCESDQPALTLAQHHKLLQVSDTAALDRYLDQVLADAKNGRIVDDIRNGKDKAIGALMGQVMKLSKGQANPKLVGDMIKQKIRG